jgi:hypothetical protein
VRRLGNPVGAPALGLTPWRLWAVFMGIFDCGRVLFGSRVAKMSRRVTVPTRHQLKQASEHHKQKRASLVATVATVVENPRTIVKPHASNFRGVKFSRLASVGKFFVLQLLAPQS